MAQQVEVLDKLKYGLPPNSPLYHLPRQKYKIKDSQIFAALKRD